MLGKKLAEEEGSTIVEFALSAVLLITIIFAIMEFSLVLYANHFLCYTAQEAARYAMVRGSSWKNATCTDSKTESCTATSSDVTSYVQSITPVGFSSSDTIAVATVWTGLTPNGTACSATNVNDSPGCVVQVQVSVSYSFFLPFIPETPLRMSSTSAVVIAS